MSVLTCVGLENRYFTSENDFAIDPISGERPLRLKYYADGKWLESKTSRYMPCYDPSTGAVIAYTPQCTAGEVEQVIQAAVAAFPGWSDTPVGRRVQVLFRMKALMDAHVEELTYLLARENGKKWDEAMGDVLKVVEVLEYACGAPHIMKGEALMNVSSGYDTTRYNHPVGVFAGIAPWNFPAMIPQGWMAPICIATGNCLVLKAASFVPQSAMRITELWQEAGLPPGVLNLITTSRNEAEILLRHPDIKGVSFVGSTSVGQHIYSTAAANGKRVQALTEAKNHALVLRDCKLDRTAQGIINAFCGCAGERCMALPVVVVENAIADRLVPLLLHYAAQISLGPAYEKSTGMGPVVNQGHKEFVLNWIEKGIQEGAELILDGRQPEVAPGCEKGFFIGPTIFDRVTEEMAVGREEIFGPVLAILTFRTVDEAIEKANNTAYGLSAGVWTDKGSRILKMSTELKAGVVWANTFNKFDPTSPFGGYKESGFGREGGRQGLLDYAKLV